MMARAARVNPCGERSETRASRESWMRPTGRRWPITPVDAARTESSGTASLRATWAVRIRASPIPSAPVQALAPPLLMSTARGSPLRSRSMERTTGAALTRFSVNSAAPTAGVSETIRARSRPPVFLIPAAIPAARNPGQICSSTVVFILPFRGAPPIRRPRPFRGTFCISFRSRRGRDHFCRPSARPALPVSAFRRESFRVPTERPDGRLPRGFRPSGAG